MEAVLTPTRQRRAHAKWRHGSYSMCVHVVPSLLKQMRLGSQESYQKD